MKGILMNNSKEKSFNKYNEERRFKEPEENVINLYKKGLTIIEISKIFHVSSSPISKIIKKHGLSRKAARRKGVGSGENNSAWKGGKRVRKDGYIIIWTKEGEMLEHRHVMELHLGRKLTKYEVVHHKDHNRSNNDIDNLMILKSQSDHCIQHGIEFREANCAGGVKECTKCHKIKKLDKFSKRFNNKNARNSWCKECSNELRKKTKK